MFSKTAVCSRIGIYKLLEASVQKEYQTCFICYMYKNIRRTYAKKAQDVPMLKIIRRAYAKETQIVPPYA